MLKFLRRRGRPDPAGPLDAFDVQDLAGLVGIWVTPESEGQQPVVSLEFLAGPKRYARVWLDKPDHVDWGWVINDRAVCIWQDGEFALLSGEHAPAGATGSADPAGATDR